MNLKVIKPASAFLRSDSGVSTAVAAALLLGILVIFITNIQVYHVPQWKEDAEYVHMSEVFEDMSRLKCNFDLISTGLEINPSSRIILNSPLRMGGGDLPIVNRMKSGGTLALNGGGCRLFANITYNDSHSEDINFGNPLDCGTISYQAVNSRYINQAYCYENGALIVVQDGQSFMKLSPAIILQKEPNNFVNLSINAVCLEGDNWVLSSNALEDIRLISRSRTTLCDSDLLTGSFYLTSVSLTIFTEYPEAWGTYFNSTTKNENIDPADYNITLNSSAVVFSLTPADEDLIVKIYKSSIEVEAL
ncbi:hypothetical protein FTO70_12590 [Methanosarcina sp. KYL-1]|uniref:hypothetical protein n=1 Tax=Methanosarcina sp. KYL-1 TaxID=2602068 RepID=UPI00210184C0|nr:hypothetical protein [Methanosarcina sp. KYL-1]MCQ1536492.1 hypothetical protein [Methanosarcina sp. KYL-1]